MYAMLKMSKEQSQYTLGYIYIYIYIKIVRRAVHSLYLMVIKVD